ncbi:MAG: FeoA family protein [Gammaproteobacteria bacterium]
MSATTLNKLKRGARARVLELDHSDTNLVAKFAARGLVPGAELSIVRSGDPLLIFVDETRWALTDVEARKVEVEDLGHSPLNLLKSIKALW